MNISKDSTLVPFDLYPRRIAEHQIETVSVNENISKLQFPMKKFVMGCDLLHEFEALRLTAYRVQVDKTEFIRR